MKRIPLHTAVMCTNGAYGESIRVIVHPETLQPTHIVVKAADDPSEEHLVEMDRVAEIGQDTIQLDCTKEEVARMPPFYVIQYNEVQIPRWAGVEMGATPYAYSETQLIKSRQELIPAGERAVAQGMEVHASDGKIGTVDELIADTESGALTHFIMREKHLWGDKAAIIPLPVIEHVVGDVVYLKPDKETIKSYLAVPTRRRRAAEEMELIILLVNRPGKPRDMLKTVKQAARQERVKLYGTAVLVKDEEGKTIVRESQDMDRRQGTVFGAVTGGLMGLLGGPAGMVVGAVAGAATGGVAAKRIDLGLPDAYLQKLQSQLQPGSAAVVALVEEGWAARVTDLTFGLEAELLRHQLSDDVLNQLPPVE